MTLFMFGAPALCPAVGIVLSAGIRASNRRRGAVPASLGSVNARFPRRQCTIAVRRQPRRGTPASARRRRELVRLLLIELAASDRVVAPPRG